VVQVELEGVVLQREHTYETPLLTEIEERERCYHEHWYTEKMARIPLLWVCQLVDQTLTYINSR
jgi:hypothetical protein